MFKNSCQCRLVCRVSIRWKLLDSHCEFSIEPLDFISRGVTQQHAGILVMSIFVYTKEIATV